MAYQLCILEVFRGGDPTLPAYRAALKMDLRIVVGSFSDTTVTVVPVSEAGKKLLGSGTESVKMPKSQLQQACEFVAEHGLKMSS